MGTTIYKEVDLKPVIVKLEVLLVGHVHDRASTVSTEPPPSHLCNCY